MHTTVPTRRHPIANHAGPRALAPGVCAALAALGYEVFPAGEAAADPRSEPRPAPVLRIADERLLEALPERSREPGMPLILLCGARPLAIDDPRIVGRIPRPALLASLYRLLQETLEQHPRSVPRTTTRLPARASRRDRRWVGSIRSLSEAGCYFEGAGELRQGDRLNLQFALPGGSARAELVTTRAECVSPREGGAGLAFRGEEEATRREIRDFVALQLAALRSDARA